MIGFFKRSKSSTFSSSEPDRYGLIAGNGQFPLLILDAARKQGVEMVVAAIKGETSTQVESRALAVEWLGVGQLGKLIKYFKREGVKKAIMAGQVKHTQIFSDALPDLRMLKVLTSLKTKNTSALIVAVADELAAEGIELIDSTVFLEPLLATSGVMTRRRPNRYEQADIDYGLRIATEIARLDLGQTVVVSDRAVVAVEAMEGTDATILRAGEIVRRRRPLTVIKVARPSQDMRFDVPVIGLPTLETMLRAGATALSITAAKTLIFDRDEVIRFANEHKITIIGCKLSS